MVPVQKKLIIGIGVFWIIVIGGFIVYQEYILQRGKEVVLKATLSLYSREEFRGHYVSLAYDIGTVTAHKKDTGFLTGNTVYVGLNVKDSSAVATGVYHERPSEKERFIKGTVENIEKNKLTINYGIEKYFVPQEKAPYILKHIDKGTATVTVVIDTAGNATIKSISLGGREI